MQDKGRGTRAATLEDALRALSRRAVELETYARLLQADLEAAQEQLAEFVDAEEHANSRRAREKARPERSLRLDPQEPRVAVDRQTQRDIAPNHGRIVPLHPRVTSTPDPAPRRNDALEHRKALAAEMRVILKTLLRDALGPTSSRTAAPPSPARPRTILRAPVGERTAQPPPVPPTRPVTSAPEPVRPAIEDRRSREIAPRPTETQATDEIDATSQTSELIPSAAEPPAGLRPLAVEPPLAEQPVVTEQQTFEELPAPPEVLPVAGDTMPNEFAPMDAAEVQTIVDVAEISAAATESPEASTAASDTEIDDGRAQADVDPRLMALAEATETAIERTVEDAIDEATQPVDAPKDVVEEPFTEGSSDPVWASPDVAADVPPVAPTIDQPTAPVDDNSDPWTIDVPDETVFPIVDESSPAPYDTSTSLDADATSTGSQEEVIDASPIEPRATVRELQVVLSPIGSFPELLRLQARIGSLSSVHTLQLRDFRNGIATFSVGVTEALTGREFGAVLQMVTELRLRLEGAGENTVELRVDPEVAP